MSLRGSKPDEPVKRNLGLYDAIDAAVVASKEPVSYAKDAKTTEQDEKQRMLAAGIHGQLHCMYI